MTKKGPRNRSSWEFVNQPANVPVPAAAPQTRRHPISVILAGKRPKRAALTVLVIIVVLGIGGAGYAYFKPNHAKPAKTGLFGQSIRQQVSIPLYYPQNLPGGYSYNNDARTIKANVLYLSVTGPGKQVFYITQQAVPASFDFVGFDKKFLNPDNFSTDAGSAIAGQVGANLIGSIQTNKNTWIIINSAGTNSLTELETAARSFEFAQ